MNWEEMMSIFYFDKRRLEGKTIRRIHMHPEKLTQLRADVKSVNSLVRTETGFYFASIPIIEEKMLPLEPGYFIEYFEGIPVHPLYGKMQ